MTVYVKLPPNSGHLSIRDKFIKVRSCTLFRGFTVYKNNSAKRPVLYLQTVQYNIYLQTVEIYVRTILLEILHMRNI